jgi:hypothetical protein
MLTSLRWALGLACCITVATVSAQDTKPAVKAKEPVKAKEAPKADKPAGKVEDIELDISPSMKAPDYKKLSEQASHEKLTDVTLKFKAGTLQTLSVDPEGRVLALVAQPRSFGKPLKDAVSEVHILSPEGKPVGDPISMKFHAHCINSDTKGNIYVAGSGKLARFDKSGKPLGDVVDLPMVASGDDAMKELRKTAEDMVKQQKESVSKAYDQIKAQQEKILAKKEEDRTKTDTANLKQYESILKSYEQMMKQDSMNVDQYVDMLASRLSVINSIALDDKNLYIVCGETKGFGYAIWKMDHDLKNAKKVMTGVSGCCGQMDLQCCENGFLLAENTKHQFARYDSEGKVVGSFGKRADKTGNVECFGGCCNPMNVRGGKNGDIYTAESEGIVKRFNSKGEFQSIVAAAPLTGGCKNVAVAVNNTGDMVYVCDQPGSKVVIYKKKSEK